MFTKGYSLTVEQRSSKSYAWVRIPLLLIKSHTFNARVTRTKFQKMYFCNFAPSNKLSFKFRTRPKKFFFNNKIVLSFFSLKLIKNLLSFKNIKLMWLVRTSVEGVTFNFLPFQSLNYAYYYELFYNLNVLLRNTEETKIQYISAKPVELRSSFYYFKTKARSLIFSRSQVPQNSKIITFRSQLSLLLLKYFFYSKFLSSINKLRPNSTFTGFLTSTKKRINSSDYQTVQNSLGYSNTDLLFLNKLITKATSRFLPKTLKTAYSLDIKQQIYFKKNEFRSFRLLVPTRSWSGGLDTKFNPFSWETIFSLFFSPILFKFVFIRFKAPMGSLINAKSLAFVCSQFHQQGHLIECKSNVFPDERFSFFFKKYFLRVASLNRFDYRTLYPFQISIIKFVQYCTGKFFFFKVYPRMRDLLTPEEVLRCALWSQKVKYYRKVLGPKLFLNESLQIIYLSLKNKDIHLFSNWATAMFYKISFWKHKTFLRYLKYVLRHFFLGVYSKISFKGIKYQLKGKISVAGNSRTRTSFHYVGFTSHATFNNKILHKLSLVRTFTGVMGFKIWFVF